MVETPIDSIVIYNRTDGDLGKRLDGFSLRVLDRNRNDVFHKDANPAPKEKATFALSGEGPEAQVRRAAMNALTYVRGKEAETFKSLAKFIREDVDEDAFLSLVSAANQDIVNWSKIE